MKRKSIISILIALTLVFSMVLASCGEKKPATLEEYISTNQEEAEEITEAAEKSGMEVTVTGNDVMYSYDMKSFDGIVEEVAKSDTMKEMLVKGLEKNDDSFIKLCAELEEESEIQGIRLIVTYTYDGETIATRTYNSIGAVEE